MRTTTDFSELVRKGEIRAFKAEEREVKELLELAERDLKQSARNLSDYSLDWSLAVSYNAILQASRAWMYFKGYRPAFGEGHAVVIRFAIATLESSFGKDVAVIDRLRAKRHTAVYEKAGATTEYEARYALNLAEKFVAFVKQKIRG